MTGQLSKTDRCDLGGCNAQAWVLATFTRGELLFCRKHYLDSKTVIDSQALAVLDETHLINGRSESSA